MVSSSRRRQQGLTLLELTVTLLILVMLTSVAVRSTSGLQDQARYQQTKDRLDMIREAILGDARKTVNGQSVVSGFVADMGRLPNNVHELLEREFCASDRTLGKSACPVADWWALPPYDGYHCTAAGYYTQADCTAAAGQWLANDGNLGGGWRGPYLQTSQNPADADAFTDGWGREAALVGDHDYGWIVAHINPYSGSADNSYWLVGSYGADGKSGGGDIYSADYPPNSLPVGAPTMPLPLIAPDDWLSRLDGGLAVSLVVPKAMAPPPGACSKNEPANNLYYTNKLACVAATGTWVGCADKTSATRSACESAGQVWFGDGHGCSDTTKTNAAGCAAAAATWANCSSGAVADKVACEGGAGIWFGDGYGCGDPTKTGKAACTAAGGTWYADWSGCSNDARKYHRFHAASPCSGSWIYNSGNWTQNDLAGNPAKVRLCLRIYSRAGGLVSTNTVYAKENGERQSLSFEAFKDAAGNVAGYVPVGENAVGVFEYDLAVGQCGANLYPEDRRIVSLSFHPRVSPPAMAW